MKRLAHLSNGPSEWRFRICLGTAFVFAAIAWQARSLCAADEFPPELVKFTPHDKNPIFTGAGPGKWDEKIKERGWILKDGDRWRMWYTGFENHPNAVMKLGHATSRDGLNWERHSGSPMLGGHWMEDMMVVKQGDTYYMFAEGVYDIAQLYTSRDGLQWTHQGPLDIRYTNGNPLTAGPRGTPTGWYENGTWHLLYERKDEGVWLAKSSDLKVWTNVQNEPVLLPGPGSYDRLMIALNQIVKHDGRYYAYYHGTGTPEKPRDWTTNVAVSTDLVHWKKYPGNPLLPEKANKSSGILIHDGKQFRLYTMHDQVHVHFQSRD